MFTAGKMPLSTGVWALSARFGEERLDISPVEFRNLDLFTVDDIATKIESRPLKSSSSGAFRVLYVFKRLRGAYFGWWEEFPAGAHVPDKKETGDLLYSKNGAEIFVVTKPWVGVPLPLIAHRESLFSQVATKTPDIFGPVRRMNKSMVAVSNSSISQALFSAVERMTVNGLPDDSSSGGGGGGSGKGSRRPGGRDAEDDDSDGRRTRARGHGPFDDLPDEMILIMIASLDGKSVRALAMVDKRFNDATFPRLFRKSSDTGKMEFMVAAILADKTERLETAFRDHLAKDWGFSMRLYFRKLFMRCSPWEKAMRFSYRSEEGMSALSAWVVPASITVAQVESALDLFIRFAFFKQEHDGSYRFDSTPKKLRYFNKEIMENLAVFHHLGMLNRFFTDPLWSQTIVIDKTVAKQEMMLVAAYAGFHEFVAQAVGDPAVDVKYKNSAVFGILTGPVLRSPYGDSESFYFDEPEGPVNIEKELLKTTAMLFASGRDFDKFNPATPEPDLTQFESWNYWWDKNNERPLVISENHLENAVTSNENMALARCLFNGKRDIIDRILPLHTPARLRNDAQLARMLLYYYPAAFESRYSVYEGEKEFVGQSLDMFERVMIQSNYTLIPPALAHRMVIYVYDCSYPQGDDERGTKDDKDVTLARLTTLLKKDTRLTTEQRQKIDTAHSEMINGKQIPYSEYDGYRDAFPELGDDDYNYDVYEEDERKKKFPNPWVVYWQAHKRSSSSSSSTMETDAMLNCDGKQSAGGPESAKTPPRQRQRRDSSSGGRSAQRN